MIKFTSEDTYTLASFGEKQRLDLRITNEVKKLLNDEINTKQKNLVLNLENVTFIDSTAFGMLISIYKTAKSANVKFEISNVSDEVYELFCLLKLQNVFSMHKTLNDAIKSI